MAGKRSLTDSRPDSVRPRALALESLEDRSVPAALAAPAAPAASLPQPDPEAIVLVRAAPAQAPSATAVTQTGAPLGKLAANHNLTLVRDRRGRTSRRR
jgi:hypothetical protein